MYISIYLDAYTIRSRGVTIFESIDLDNKDLAELIGKAVADVMDIPFRGARENESTKYRGEDYYTDIDVAQDSGIPYVFLLERGFHSNPNEEAKLKDDDIVKAYAVAAGKALQEYFFGDMKEVVNVEKEHWVLPYYDELNKVGVEISEKRFDDPITRGEVFALICRIIRILINMETFQV